MREPGMPQLMSVFLGLSFDEITPEIVDESHAAESYAVALCAEEQAHFSVLMAAPIFRVPGAGLLSLSHGLVDEINAARRTHAEEAEKRIGSATRIAAVTAEFRIVQSSYPNSRDRLAAAARLSDIVILARPTYGFP